MCLKIKTYGKNSDSAQRFFFYTIISRKENATILFDRHLPDRLKGKLDLNTLQLCEAKTIGSGFKTLFKDVLYKCDSKSGQPAYLYPSSSMKATHSYTCPLRILEYKIAGIRQHVNQGHEKYPLCANLVVYTGTRPWNYFCRLGDYFIDREMGEQILYMAPFTN